MIRLESSVPRLTSAGRQRAVHTGHVTITTRETIGYLCLAQIAVAFKTAFTPCRLEYSGSLELSRPPRGPHLHSPRRFMCTFDLASDLTRRSPPFITQSRPRPSCSFASPLRVSADVSRAFAASTIHGTPRTNRETMVAYRVKHLHSRVDVARLPSDSDEPLIRIDRLTRLSRGTGVGNADLAPGLRADLVDLLPTLADD